MNTPVDLREARPDDRDGIRELHLHAFPASESEDVARLADELLGEPVDPPVLSLVAEQAGAVVAHGAFSPVWSSDTGALVGYILGPLGVLPGHQKSGFGSLLTRRGIEVLRERGAPMLFVYGDPAYYQRFGFKVPIATDYEPPHTLEHPFGWQAMPLTAAQRPAPGRLRCVDALDRPELW